MNRHNFFIPDDLWEGLRKLSADKDESVASIIRRAIAALLKKEAK